jgi:hypothetical protein
MTDKSATPAEGEHAMTEPTAEPNIDSESTHDALELLGSGVPLSLVLDLASDRPSEEIYSAEPGSADWLEAPSH